MWLLRIALIVLLVSITSAGASAHRRVCPPGQNPDWVERPTGEEFSRYYPTKESPTAIDGDVTLACVVDELGKLKHCAVAAEAPKGYGFGRNALRLVHYFRLARPGCPLSGSTLKVPIRFRHASN
jgi:protein TonB